MINIAAREARANFGELMDTVQREPVSIEKHGRAVAVVISAVEYENMKTELLKSRIKSGCGQIERGEFSQLSILEIFEEAKDIHAKIQAIPAS